MLGSSTSSHSYPAATDAGVKGAGGKGAGGEVGGGARVVGDAVEDSRCDGLVDVTPTAVSGVP